MIHQITDLMPSTTLAKGLSALAAAILVVEPELIIGLGAVVLLNGVASIWYSFYTDDQTAGVVVYSLVVRIIVYAITMPGVIILSHMVGVDVLRRLAFGAAAGWEVAVTLGLAARISPSFEPTYVQLMDFVDDHTPLDATAQDVNDSIDGDQNA